MAGAEGTGALPQQLTINVGKIRSRAEDLRGQTVEAAEAVAMTGEALATTLYRLAGHLPHRADHLRAMSETALKLAADARQWAKDHALRHGLTR